MTIPSIAMPAEPLDRPAIDRPLEAEPDGGELDDDAAEDRERKERKHVEEVRAEETERPSEHLQQCDADGDRHAEEYRRSRDLRHPPPLVHRCVVGTRQMVIDVQISSFSGGWWILASDGNRRRVDRVLHQHRADNDPGDHADRRQAKPHFQQLSGARTS